MDTVVYSAIQPPFTLKFWEMSKKELREYYKWFMEAIPQRINILASAVRGSPGFKDWRPDYTPASLSALGDWFATQVETRPRTQQERQELMRSCRNPIEAPDCDLTNRTFSLAMDVGMYLSQVFLRNHPSLKWDQPFGSTKFIDYGQPVLVGGFAGDIPWNPVGIVVTLAYALVKKTKTGAALREVYDKGSKMIRESSAKEFGAESVHR
jgi:hypothetical protein